MAVLYMVVQLKILKNYFSPRHIRVQEEKDLGELQWSKYVQSDIGEIYIQAKKDLKNRLPVLFTGTPCQIAGFLNG